MKLTEEKFDYFLSKARGGFLGLSCCVLDRDGNLCEDNRVQPGRFLVAENYYGYAVLYVDDDLTLVQCERE